MNARGSLEVHPASVLLLQVARLEAKLPIIFNVKLRLLDRARPALRFRSMDREREGCHAALEERFSQAFLRFRRSSSENHRRWATMCGPSITLVDPRSWMYRQRHSRQ